MASVPPIVSVCTPTYNRASLLAQAIRSVLGQTFQDFELLISDNASTDGTEAVVRSFDDPRIRYVRNPRNLGDRANYGRCLQLARGTYLTMLADDDLMMPDNLAAKVAVLSKHARVGLVHSKYHVINGNGDMIRYSTNWGHGPDRMEDAIEPGQDVVRAMLLTFNVINGSTAMFRRACYERVGGYTDQLLYTFDIEFWMRIALHYDVAFLATPLIQWRFHQGSITIQHTVRPDGRPAPENWKALFGAKMLILKHHLPELQGGNDIKATVSVDLCQKTFEVAEDLLDRGEPKAQVRRFLLDMFRILPSILLQRRLWKIALKSVFPAPVLSRLKRLVIFFSPIGRVRK